MEWVVCCFSDSGEAATAEIESCEFRNLTVDDDGERRGVRVEGYGVQEGHVALDK